MFRFFNAASTSARVREQAAADAASKRAAKQRDGGSSKSDSMCKDAFGFNIELSARQLRKFEMRARVANAHWDTLLATRGSDPASLRALLGGTHGDKHAPHEDVVDLVQRHGIAARYRRTVWRLWVRILLVWCAAIARGPLAMLQRAGPRGREH